MKKVVFIQGAFEIIHPGHIQAFKSAKQSGDYLVVAINSNRLLKEYKQRDGVMTFEQKAFIIRAIKYVDKVIEIDSFSPILELKKYKVDVYCITHEWKKSKKLEMAYMKSKGGTTKILPRFKNGIATSQIKRILLKEAQEGFMN